MTHRSIKSLIILILLVLLGAIVPRVKAQSIVTNGSFETSTVPSGNGIEIGAPADLGGWILDRGSIDLVAARGYYQVAVGSQCIFLSGGSAGSIYQDLNTTPGQTYRLKFAMSGDPGKPGWPLIKHMEVDWDNSVVDTPTFDITSTTPANMGWTYHEYLVTATTNVTRLRFSSLDFDPTGPAVDDVTLTPSLPLRNLTVSPIGPTFATVTWVTDVPASSTVEYGRTTAYGNTISQGGLVTNHRVDLSNLSPSTLYHYRVKSTDANNQATVSGDGTFVTGPLNTATFDINYSNVQRLADGSYTVDITFTNKGGKNLNGIDVNGASLGNARPIPPGIPPLRFDLLGGTTHTFTLHFPATAGAPRTSVTLAIGGDISDIFGYPQSFYTYNFRGVRLP